MLSEPATGAILLVNAIMNGPWMVALSLAIALIVTEYRPTFLGFGDLAAYALVMGAYGVGDVIGQHHRRQRALPPSALDHVPGLRRDGHRLLLARRSRSGCCRPARCCRR